MKIVINSCHGGFQLSHEAMMLYASKKNMNLIPVRSKYAALVEYDYYLDEVKDEHHFWHDRIPRNDPALVEVVQELGEKANTRFSKLKIVVIPDDVMWQIQEYDGSEWVAEVHRTWG